MTPQRQDHQSALVPHLSLVSYSFQIIYKSQQPEALQSHHHATCGGLHLPPSFHYLPTYSSRDKSKVWKTHCVITLEC